jgi:hypothetical protein
LLKVREIRNQQVDSGELRSGKHDSGVDHDSGVAVRHGHQVHPELAQAAKWDDVEVMRHLRERNLLELLVPTTPIAGECNRPVRFARPATIQAAGCCLMERERG